MLEYALQAMPEDASSIHQLGKIISKLRKNEVERIKTPFQPDKTDPQWRSVRLPSKPLSGVLMGDQWQAHRHPDPKHHTLQPYLSTIT